MGISEGFKRIFSFIDFGNVNYWFARDEKTATGHTLRLDRRLNIDLRKLNEFLGLFSSDTRFYYGHDPANEGSLRFIRVARDTFGKNRAFTKPIQKIRDYLDSHELPGNTRAVATDASGDYVLIPKCNFDVEISVDAIRLLDSCDTICLLSSDADFASLLRFLKKKEKKVILIKGGRISGVLGELVDLKINAQDVKAHLTTQKQKPGV